MDLEVSKAGIAAALAARPRIAAAWIFGSMTRGEAGPDSDLDVAVLLKGPHERADAMELYDLSGELERFSPSGRVDVVVLGPQGPVFRHRVLREGVLVHDADPEARHDFEGRTTVAYLDWKPTHDIAMRSVFEGLRRRFAAGPRRREG